TSEQLEISAPGQIGIERLRLHEAGNPVRYGSARRVQIAAQEAQSSGVPSDEPEQDANQRRFPCAVRAEERVQPTRSSDKIHLSEGIAIAVALGHAERLQWEPFHV